ncbi:unnamed protein product [Urochloa humidicola]
MANHFKRLISLKNLSKGSSLATEVVRAMCCSKKMQGRYVQALHKLDDDTSPIVCVNIEGNSHSKYITKELPIQNNTIIVQYTRKGQPYMQAVFSEDNSNNKNEK